MSRDPYFFNSNYMKNIKYLFFMAFAVMLSVSCSSDDDSGANINDSALVGTWGYTEIDEAFEIEALITFNSNKSGVLVYSFTLDEETDTETENFTWSTDGNKLSLSSGGVVEIFSYSIAGNKLTLADSDGESTVFTKQ